MRHPGIVSAMGMCCCVCLMPLQTAKAQTCLGVSTEILAQPMQQDCGGEPCPPIDCTVELGLDICRVYADFDSQFPVHLLAVGNADITTTDPEGFFQHPFGNGAKSPHCVFIPPFPDLQCDSFVTVNATCNDAADSTALGPDFDCDPSIPNLPGNDDCNANPLQLEWFAQFGHVYGSWFNSNPPNGQGNPLPGPDPDIFRVLIAQFAISAGENVSGSLEVFWHEHVGLGKTQSTMADFSCIPLCPADFDGSGDVRAPDLANLLGSWGPCPGCPADLDGDGAVGAPDLALLLGAWGLCS